VVGAGQAAAALPPEDLAQIQELGVDLEQLVRVTGFVLVATALVYLLLGVLAWTGRRWARGLLAAVTAGFVLMVATSAVAAGSQGLPMDGGSLLVLGVPLVLALLALALMFGSAARDWFARRR
jgi:predicted anti-sigma-YlaC factor YlaD